MPSPRARSQWNSPAGRAACLKRRRLAAFAALALSACATVPEDTAPATRAEATLARFSQVVAGGELPSGWEPWIVDRRKPATRYSLAEDDGRVVVCADAQRSVSGLAYSVVVDPVRYPRVGWRWKVEQLIPDADERDAAREDSPARLIIALEGDHARLDPEERAKLSLASTMSGRPPPYATLMYVWSNEHAPGTIIANPRTSRVRMIVVEQGAARLGRWLEYERDVVSDYRRAFAEDPGLITAVGLMTDADDTQSSALTYYGDIVLRPPSSR